MLSHVRLGEWDLTQQQDCADNVNERICATPVVDIAIEQRIPHPQYDPYGANQHNDIALLRLGQQVQYNEYIRPICLPIELALKNNKFEKQVEVFNQ